MKRNHLGMIALLAISGAARYRNEVPAVVTASANRLRAIDADLQNLFTKDLKDGLPTPENLTRIEALEAEAKQLTALQAAAKRSAELAEIPESQRFQAEFKLSASEEKDFSKFSLLQASQTVLLNGRPDGFINEMRQLAAEELQQSGVIANLPDVALPRQLVQYLASKSARYRASTQSVSGTNLGSQFVPTELRADLMQLTSLLPTPVLEQIGAFVLRGLKGNISIPTIAPTGALTNKTENATANAVDHTTGSKSMTPKRLPAYVDISDQLVMQSSPDVEALILSLMLERLAVTKDDYAITGNGTAPAPTGILSTNGIGSVAGGTNGLAPTYDHMVDLETAVANANASANRYLTNSKVRGKLKKTPVVSGQNGMVWDAMNNVNGYGTAVTNIVPSTLTKGSSSGVCSAVIFADFSKLLIGYWGGLLIEKHRDKAGAIIGTGSIVVTEFWDSIVLQPANFAAMQDALTA